MTSRLRPSPFHLRSRYSSTSMCARETVFFSPPSHVVIRPAGRIQGWRYFGGSHCGREHPRVTHYFRLAVLIFPSPLLAAPRPSRNTHAGENTARTRQEGRKGTENAIVCRNLDTRAPPRPTPPTDFTWLPYNNFNNPGTPRCPGLIPIPNDREIPERGDG